MASINAQFRNDIVSFFNNAKGFVQAVNREVLLEIGRRLVDRSPIGNPLFWKHPPHKGYSPGHFLLNWQVGIDTVPTTVISGTDTSRDAAKERLSRLGRWTVGHTYHFVNNAPYADALENGHSKTQCPPGGMVMLTTLEFQQIVHDAEIKVARAKHWAFEG